MDRAAYLTGLLGQKWTRERSCWHVAVEVQSALFGRTLPLVALPDDLTWRWMMETIDQHPERGHWREVPKPAMPGLINAPDGALVAMARAHRAAHIGVWLAPERRVIHCDETFGVQIESVPTLRASGWNQVRFFEPIGAEPT